MSDGQPRPGKRPSLRELDALRALIATGKTTNAARVLGVSQPAVSRAVAALEARTGRRLFARASGRLVPTADALALDAQAVPLFDALDRLAEWPDARAGGGRLAVACTPTLAHGFLASLVPELMAAEPGLSLSVEIGKTADVVGTVADRVADSGSVDRDPAHEGVRAQVLRRGVAHVALPAGHPLAARATITAGDLDGEPLIALTRRFPARALLDAALREAGAVPRLVAEVATGEFAVALVARGLGLAVLNPYPLEGTAGPGVAFRRFSPAVPFETCALTPAASHLPPAARRLLALARRAAG